MSLAVLRANPRYPKARWRPVPGWEITGTLTDTVNLKIVWHKTQGNGDPFTTYKRTGGIPDLTLHRDGRWDQHYTFDVFSRALKNLRGGIETNRDGVIQIEVVGFVGQEATDIQLAEIVEFTAWAQNTLGIPNVWPQGRPMGSADHADPTRSSVFDNTGGHYGHSQVGEQDHTDPKWTDREWAAIGAGMAPLMDQWHTVFNNTPNRDPANGIIQWFQAGLDELGHWNPDKPIDGVMRNATRNAWHRFEISKGYPKANERPGKVSIQHFIEALATVRAADCATIEAQLNACRSALSKSEDLANQADITNIDLKAAVRKMIATGKAVL